MIDASPLDSPELSEIHVLCVSPSLPELAETIRSADRLSAQGVPDTERALAEMGSEIDCVVATHEPPVVDAPALHQRLRDAGHEQPFVLYGPQIQASVVETIIAAGDEYLCSQSDTPSRTVLTTRIEAVVDADRTRRDLELQSRAMKQAPVGITIADAQAGDEPLVYINDQFEAVTGYPVSVAVGENCRFLQGPGTSDETVAEIREAIDQQKPVSVEILNYRRDNTPFWNQLDIAPVENNGTVTHFFGFQKDITERRVLTENLTHQLELQDRFASIISHDLRNPLTLAKGHLEMALDEYDDSNLDEVDYALDRIDELIDSVLTMARQGTAIVDPEPIDLDAVVERAGEIVDVPVDVMGELPAVKGEPDRLSTVFENLFRNSVDHRSTNNQRASRADDSVDHRSTNSRPQADDSVDHRSTNNQRASRADDTDDGFGIRVGPTENGFYVEDDGPGIPEADRESVFDWGVTMSEDGTGYGLALVRTIARAHGWDVTITDGTTGGARFEFAIGTRPTAMGRAAAER